jgi:hypothetical protein
MEKTPVKYERIFTFVVSSVILVEPALAVFHVILELACVSGAILIKVLPEAILDVVFPVPNVQLTLDIVVLAFTVFGAFKELTFIAFTVLISHNSPTMWQSVFGLTLVNGAVWTLDCLDVDLGTFGLLVGLLKHACQKRWLDVFFSHLMCY